MGVNYRILAWRWVVRSYESVRSPWVTQLMTRVQTELSTFLASPAGPPVL